MNIGQWAHLRLYSVHSWTGAVLGLFLFAVCFSGAPALFFEELGPWERAPARGGLPAEPAAIDAAIAELSAALGPDMPGSFVIAPPRQTRPTIVIAFEPAGGQGERHRLEFDPTSGRLIGPVRDGVALFLVDFHTDLHLPRPWGRYLVGLGGIVMMLSIVTGVLIHSKILRNLHVFRIDRSRRLAWADGHRVLGVWALPFHVMIAFSGALLGLAGLLISILALAAFDGDREKAVATILGSPVAASGEPSGMSSLDDILADARQRTPSAEPALVVVSHWRDAAAVASVRVEGFPTLEAFREHRYSLVDGRYAGTWSLGDTAGGRVYAALTPLHYGTYGGLALKVVYAVLGLVAAMAIATGLVIWLQRRQQQSRGAGTGLAAVFVGATAGMALATAGAFAAHHAVPAGPTATYWIGVVYFSLWLASIALAIVLRHPLRAGSILVTATAAAFACAPAVRLLAEGADTFLSSGVAALSTDIVFLALAGACAALASILGRGCRTERGRLVAAGFGHEGGP